MLNVKIKKGGFYMNTLKNIMKFQNRIFKSMKIICIIFYVVGIGSLGLLSYFTVLKMPFLSFHHTIARFSYYICMSFSFIIYDYLIQSQKNSIDEVVESTRQSHFHNAFLFMATLITTYHIILILIILWNAMLTIDKSYSCQYALISYLFNCFIPQIIFIAIATITAKMKNETLGFILFAIFSFLTGPFFESMNWYTKPDFPIDIIIEKITQLFHIFYQNGQASPDSLYGLQIEAGRFIIFLFWIILIITTILVLKVKNKKIIIIPTLILSFLVVQTYKDRSIYRLSMDYKNAGYSDLYHYGFFEGKLENYKEAKEANFFISNYQMNIDIKDKLYVSTIIDIKANKPIKECLFTLYRGYQVKDIQSKDIQSYQQIDDQVLIIFKEKLSQSSIHMNYQGYHPIYYSNENATMLPGYFPWYPMPGEKQIFVNYSNSYGMNAYNRVNPCQFDVTIHSHHSFVTNLNNENGHYIGKADSLTIIGGNIKKTNDSIIQNILPLDYAGDGIHTEKEYIQRLNTNLSKSIKALKEIYHIDLNLDHKKVIIASKDLSRNYSNNKITLYDDYILCSVDTLYVDAIDNLLEYYLTTPNYQGTLKNLIIFSATTKSFEDFKTILFNNMKFNMDNDKDMLAEWNPTDEGYNDIKMRYQMYTTLYPYLQEDKNILSVIQWLHEGYNDNDILKMLESGDYS